MSSTDATLPADPPRRRPARGHVSALALFALAWLLLWLAGFPQPNVDDGFFTGVAISLARDGQLANPWVTGWMGYIEGSHPSKFLVQPPFYPLVMAAWITGFGVSAASLTGFACGLGFLATGFAWMLLLRLTGDRLAAALGAAVVGAAMLQRGLRPEPLAMLCFLSGQWLLLSWRRPGGWLAGGIANSAAVLAHPIWVILVVPATVIQIHDAWRTRLRLPSLLIALAGGIAVVALALLGYLGRDWSAFFHDLAAHGRFVSRDMTRMEAFITHLTFGYERYVHSLLLVLAIAATVIAARRHRTRVAAIAAGFGLMLVLGVALYAAQTTVYLIRSVVILPLLYPLTGWNRWLAVAPALLFLGWFTLQTNLQLAGDRQWDERTQRAPLATYLDSAQPDLVLFDAATLRWQFDYRPPAGAIDLSWAWSPGHPERFWNPAAIGPRDVWVIDPAWSHLHLPAKARRGNLVLAQRTFRSVRSSRACLVIVGADLPAPASLPFTRSSAL